MAGKTWIFGDGGFRIFLNILNIIPNAILSVAFLCTLSIQEAASRPVHMTFYEQADQIYHVVVT